MLETTANGAAAQELVVILQSSAMQTSAAVEAGAIRLVVMLMKADDAAIKAHGTAVVEAIARTPAHGPALVAASALML